MRGGRRVSSPAKQHPSQCAVTAVAVRPYRLSAVSSDEFRTAATIDAKLCPYCALFCATRTWPIHVCLSVCVCTHMQAHSHNLCYYMTFASLIVHVSEYFGFLLFSCLLCTFLSCLKVDTVTVLWVCSSCIKYCYSHILCAKTISKTVYSHIFSPRIFCLVRAHLGSADLIHCTCNICFMSPVML